MPPTPRPAFNAPLVHVGGELASARLRLEPLTPAHAAAMYDGLADPRLYTWMHVAPPESVADLAQRFERVGDPYAPTGELWLNWAIRVLEPPSYAGLIEATVRPDRVTLITYYVFPGMQRRGYGREACEAAIEHLWRAYDAAEVRCEMDYRNVPARCLAESLGFVRRSHMALRRFGDATFSYCRYRLKRT